MRGEADAVARCSIPAHIVPFPHTAKRNRVPFPSRIGTRFLFLHWHGSWFSRGHGPPSNGDHVQTLLHDIRHAARSLRRSPGFTTIAVLTLALGIGANTAIFSVVDGVLLRPAPFEQVDRLVMVWETDRNSDTTREPASFPDYLDFQEQSRSFEALAAFNGAELNLTPGEGDPMRLAALAVSHEFLPLVGIQPLVGRTFTAQEDRPSGPRVALIGEALWGQLFSRDPAVVGRTIRLNEEVHTIIGVLPATAEFGALQIFGAAAYMRTFADRRGRVEVDAWIPLRASPESYPRETHPFFVLGRLAPGIAPTTAQQEMSGIAAELERTYPENDGRGVFIESLGDVVFGPVRPALLVLLGAVALVLLVACVNVANLLLARGTSRVREVAVRGALGAGIGQLTRQFLVESALLTLVAASVGVVVAGIGVDVIRAMAPGNIPRASSVDIDARVLVTTLIVSMAVSLLFGLLPAWQARHVDLQDALKGDAGRGASAGREHRRLRGALVVVELALAVVLMVGAGLLVKSLWHLQQIDPGFQTTGVLKAEYELPASRYPSDSSAEGGWPEIRRFSDALVSRTARIPGVQFVALAANHPLDAGFTSSVVVVGREAEARGWPEPSLRFVSPEYFRTVGVPLLQGRVLRDSDDTSPGNVALINEAARRRYFSNQNPLNQRIRLWGFESTIVGVVANERIHGLTGTPPPAVHLPLAKVPLLSYTLLVRFTGAPNVVGDTIRGVVRELDPALPIFGVEPLQQTLHNSLGQQRFTMLVLGLFAVVALFLAAVGVYGVLSYAVSQRTREIGIRMAVGANPRDVRRLVLGEGVRFMLAGAGLGLLAAFALTRVLTSLLYGVSTRDPWIFAGVSLLLGGVALLATYLPSRRASRVDPIVALRAE
ncbi:MAG: FtsX-like permease family protein [Luteitalea sp.]|nr:FtsX-like permease family protein [Luteitalea sp.]